MKEVFEFLISLGLIVLTGYAFVNSAAYLLFSYIERKIKND